MALPRLPWVAVGVALTACTTSTETTSTTFGDTSSSGGGDSAPPTTAGEGTTEAPGSESTAASAEASTGSSTTGAASEGTGTEDTGDPIFDVGAPADLPNQIDMCKVGDGGDAPAPCKDVAPPDSFEPEVQWSWNEVLGGVTTPLVANLTDDNGDGEIDLCDTPDVVVVAGIAPDPRRVYVLDGATGQKHWESPVDVRSVTPAIGDIDDDGLVEVVTVDFDGNLVALANDGALEFSMPVTWPGPGGAVSGGSAIALADADNDGDVEILGAGFLTDHQGQQLWNVPVTDPMFVEPSYYLTWLAPTMADLDGDGDLELVFGATAYHHDGVLYYDNPAIRAGYPQVGNLDQDAFPEVLVTNGSGLTVLEHDGTTKYADLTPTGDPTTDWIYWARPATIHDLDGDDAPEFAMSSRTHYSGYRPDATLMWSVDVADLSGIAAGTAFDFLGDGSAEAMYADETTLFVLDGSSGAQQLVAPRSSGTLIEYPSVADVDNDGSAEILVVSMQTLNGGPQTAPTLQVIRDKEDRWIQARRIWNQHTYHVTNVNEDGSIPQYEVPNWEVLNTFRTNAQIEGGNVCRPAG